MYDPVVGRFLEEDPEGFEPGDPNLFRYVENSPTNFTDPSGLKYIVAKTKQGAEAIAGTMLTEAGVTVDITSLPDGTFRIQASGVKNDPKGNVAEAISKAFHATDAAYAKNQTDLDLLYRRYVFVALHPANEIPNYLFTGEKAGEVKFELSDDSAGPSGMQGKGPQVILNQKITKEPVVGTYGNFIWPVRFELDKETAVGGWMIQDVDVVYKAFNGKDDVTEKIFGKNSDRHFWEAWEVKKGTKAPLGGVLNPMAREFLAKLARVLAANYFAVEKGGDPRQKHCLASEKDIRDGKWDGTTDVFLHAVDTGFDLKGHTNGTITITAEVFFVENPALYEGMKRVKDAGATGANKNSAGVAPNLTKDDSPTAEGMREWLTQNAAKTSNKIKRVVVVSWETSDEGAITTVTVEPPP